VTQVTEDTFEQVLSHFSEPVIDLRDVAFIDPYGMVGLLEIGEVLKSKRELKAVYLPQSEDVLKYLERMDFFKFADTYFKINSTDVSSAFDLPSNTSGTRLLNLYKKRLVRRVEESRKDGKVWAYERLCT
jgi:hypothetical protein